MITKEQKEYLEERLKSIEDRKLFSYMITFVGCGLFLFLGIFSSVSNYLLYVPIIIVAEIITYSHYNGKIHDIEFKLKGEVKGG